MDDANFIINDQNTRSFLTNCPIFNPKPPLESPESQLSDLAYAPGALIRQNTVLEIRSYKWTRVFVFDSVS